MGSVCCLNDRCLIFLLLGHACLGLVPGGTGRVSADSTLTQRHLRLHRETASQCRSPQGVSVFLGSALSSDI